MALVPPFIEDFPAMFDDQRVLDMDLARFCHPSEQVPKFKALHIPEDGGGIRCEKALVTS